jgi:hypothetical protein
LITSTWPHHMLHYLRGSSFPFHVRWGSSCSCCPPHMQNSLGYSCSSVTISVFPPFICMRTVLRATDRHYEHCPFHSFVSSHHTSVNPWPSLHIAGSTAFLKMVCRPAWTEMAFSGIRIAIPAFARHESARPCVRLSLSSVADPSCCTLWGFRLWSLGHRDCRFESR